MRPEDLLQRYAYRPGVCWRCEHPGLVSGLTGWLPPELLTCPVCILRLDQIRNAAAQRQHHATAEAARLLTLAEITEQWPAATRRPRPGGYARGSLLLRRGASSAWGTDGLAYVEGPGRDGDALLTGSVR
jgi:hypothetical protein